MERRTVKTLEHSNNYVTSVRRALQILKIFSQADDSLLLGEISRYTDLPKSTTHRLLSSLEAEGFIEQDPQNGEYHLGIELVRLGKVATENMDLPKIARGEMEKLSKITQQTSNFYVMRDFKRVCIAQVSGPNYIRRHSYLGATFPLYCGASGKVFLAYSTAEYVERYFDHVTLKKITDRTMIDRQELEKEFEQIRKQGYSSTVGERDATTASVAVPIFNHTGNIVGSLTVSGPSACFTDDNVSFYAKNLIMAGKQISRRAGYCPDYL